MRKLLWFLLFVLAVMVICAMIPVPPKSSTTAPLPTFTPVQLKTSAAATPATSETILPIPASTELPHPAATLPPAGPMPVTTSDPLAKLSGSPSYLPGFPHTDLGCAWAGIGGQVLGDAGEGIDGAVVVVSGDANGQPVEGLALSGTASFYGPGGFEIDLSRYISLGGETVQIRVMDMAGSPLSELVLFNLPPSCAENLVLIHFTPAGAAAVSGN